MNFTMNPLEKELESFFKNRKNLISEHPSGGFVVIKDDKIIGVWNDRMDALAIGLEKFGNTSFLVKNIMDERKTLNFNYPFLLL